nr:hypothetical protein [Listeria seeligeri]
MVKPDKGLKSLTAEHLDRFRASKLVKPANGLKVLIVELFDRFRVSKLVKPANGLRSLNRLPDRYSCFKPIKFSIPVIFEIFLLLTVKELIEFNSFCVTVSLTDNFFNLLRTTSARLGSGNILLIAVGPGIPLTASVDVSSFATVEVSSLSDTFGIVSSTCFDEVPSDVDVSSPSAVVSSSFSTTSPDSGASTAGASCVIGAGDSVAFTSAAKMAIPGEATTVKNNVAPQTHCFPFFHKRQFFCCVSLFFLNIFSIPSFTIFLLITS